MRSRVVVASLLAIASVVTAIVATRVDAAVAGTPAYQRLVFASNRSGGYDLWTANLDGSGLTRITTTGGGERPSNQAYSPDGTKLVFMRAQSNPDIHSSNADGSDYRRLTDAWGEDCCPVWSFDGSSIAFESLRTGVFEIFRMNADGTNEVNLTNNFTYDGTPTWSPFGRIAYRSNIDRGNDIYSVALDGSGRTRLTTFTRMNRTPAWSPDGATIAFVSNRTGNDEIWVMNADGSNERQLTFAPGQDLNPSWSPDGTKIAFSSNRAGNNEIWVINADGSNPVRVTNHSASDILPSWYPVMCTAWGGPGDDVVTGTEGNDVLCGFGGDDTLNGRGGNDTLIGGPGNDVEKGGDGNDRFDQGPAAEGADRLFGGSGIDIVSYLHRALPVNVSLNAVVGDGAAGEGDNVDTDIENAVGGIGGDTLTANGVANLLVGGMGNDILTGGGGVDVLQGLDGNDSLNAQDAIAGDTVEGGVGNDTCSTDPGDVRIACP